MKNNKLTGDINTINNVLKRHLNIKYRHNPWKTIQKYDLDYLKGLVKNKADFYLTIQNLYTFYLQEIEKLNLDKDFKIPCRLYEDKLEYAEDSYTFEIATDLAVDLIRKAIGHNDRNLIYPIPIEFVITLGFHNNIEEKNIDKAIWFFLLYIALAYFDLCIEKNFNIEK